MVSCFSTYPPASLRIELAFFFSISTLGVAIGIPQAKVPTRSKHRNRRSTLTNANIEESVFFLIYNVEAIEHSQFSSRCSEIKFSTHGSNRKRVS